MVAIDSGSGGRRLGNVAVATLRQDLTAGKSRSGLLLRCCQGTRAAKRLRAGQGVSRGWGGDFFIIIVVLVYFLEELCDGSFRVQETIEGDFGFWLRSGFRFWVGGGGELAAGVAQC